MPYAIRYEIKLSYSAEEFIMKRPGSTSSTENILIASKEKKKESIKIFSVLTN